jgi:uncharacterized protein YndB with AHSA1/START domain
MPSITIDAPAEKVWKAMTDPAQRKKWFFGVDTRSDWIEGSPIVHTGEWNGKPYKDKGVAKKVVPGEKLVHTLWSSMSGRSDKPEKTISYSLTELNGATEVGIVENRRQLPRRCRRPRSLN